MGCLLWTLSEVAPKYVRTRIGHGCTGFIRGYGAKGLERSAMLVCAAALVHWGRQVAIGAKLTDRLGDLSYGVYIYAFPIQQLVIGWGRGRQIPFGALLAMSLLLTWGFAYLSWHVVEARALRFKPMDRGNR